MLKAVIFDLDDTLYEYKIINKEAIAALCEYTCKQLDISTTVFQEAFQWARNEVKRLLPQVAAGHNRLLYCQKTLEYLKENPIGMAIEMYEIYWGYILEHMRLREGAIELLEYCKRIDLKVGVCTDLTTYIQHRKLRKLEIAGYIDALISSEEAGIEKPGEAIYKMILCKLQVNPDEALFIGDDFIKDVEGPQKMGMKSLWLSAQEKEGIVSIDSLIEAKEIIDGFK